jgi:predicted enzyme related to lactoylglutathione lyase
MADKSVRGRFVWHELMTPDTAGAHAFYSKVLGWKTQPFEHDPSYSMFAASSGPLGGSVALPAGAPHWLAYVGTPDIDATVQQARSLGGSVTTEPTSIPNGGKYAVLKDPQGASFGVYQSTQDAGKESTPKRGEFSWHELAATDHKGAIDFYSQLFGWESMQEHDMGGSLGVYRIFGSNGVQRGGMFNKSAEMQGGPAWVGYVRVKSVDDAVKKVKAARGTLINGPMEVPGGDWIANFLDPHGAMFAVHAFAADLKAASGAAKPAAQASAPAAEATPKAEPASAPKAASPAKKAAKKKAAPKKKAAAKKKKRAAAKAAKRPARKAGKKSGRKKAGKKVAKKRSGGKKKAARKARRKK